MRILFVSAEVHPLMKTGGLADVSASLPRALQSLGHEVRVLMPAYRDTLQKASALGVKLVKTLELDGYSLRLLQTRLPNSRNTTWLLDVSYSLASLAHTELQTDDFLSYGFGLPSFVLLLFVSTSHAYDQVIPGVGVISFPSRPVESVQVMNFPTGERKATHYRTDTPGISMIVTLGRFDQPITPATQSNLLNEMESASVRTMTSGPYKISVVESKKISYAGVAGREGKMICADPAMKITYRAFVLRDNSVSLMTIVKVGATDADANAFFRSLRWTQLSAQKQERKTPKRSPDREPSADEISRLRTENAQLRDELSKNTAAQQESQRCGTLDAWRQLRKGMTAETVKSTLGEPSKIDAYSMIGDKWHYKCKKFNSGRVSFDKDALVEGWSEPEFE